MEHSTAHNELDRDHHNVIAKHYDRLIVQPRKTINDRAFRFIKTYLKHPALAMLDLGAGTGHMSVRFGSNFRTITLVDHSEGMLEKAKTNTSHIKANKRFETCEAFEFLKKSNQQFDLITCVGFLHHLEPHELNELFGLLHNALSAKGKIILAEPVATAAIEPSAVRWWNKAMRPKIEEYLSLAPTPDEAPLNLGNLKQAYADQGFSLIAERRGWEIFARFNNNMVDQLAINVLDRLFNKDGVVWIAVIGPANA